MTGRWSLVSGCQVSQWFILTCIVHDGDKPRLTPAGAPESQSEATPGTRRRVIE